MTRPLNPTIGLSVGDGGTGRLVLHKGATLSAALPASLSESAVALMLGNDSTGHFDVSPSTAIDVRGPATLLGHLELQQSASFESGAFLPVLRATKTNISIIQGGGVQEPQLSPYLRLAGSNPQQFTAIDMAGNPIGHLSFGLPNRHRSRRMPAVQRPQGLTLDQRERRLGRAIIRNSESFVPWRTSPFVLVVACRPVIVPRHRHGDVWI